MNYYKEIIEKIQVFIDEEKYNEARILLEDELSQPYVPSEYEAVFSSLYREVVTCIKADESTGKTHQTIINNLFSTSADLKTEAVMNIAEMNLNSQDLDFVNIFFKNELDNTLKTLLFQILISKNVDYTFDFVNDSFKFELNPVTTPGLSEFYNRDKINKIIDRDTFKEPSLKIMSDSVVDRVLLNSFPKLLPDKPEKLAVEIVSYCRNKLYGDIDLPPGHFSALEKIVNQSFTISKN